MIVDSFDEDISLLYNLANFVIDVHIRWKTKHEMDGWQGVFANAPSITVKSHFSGA